MYLKHHLIQFIKMNNTCNLKKENSRKILGTTFLLFACVFISIAQNEKENIKSENGGYSVAAYIWPSCHHDQRFGDILWPEVSVNGK